MGTGFETVLGDARHREFGDDYAPLIGAAPSLSGGSGAASPMLVGEVSVFNAKANDIVSAI